MEDKLNHSNESTSKHLANHLEKLQRKQKKTFLKLEKFPYCFPFQILLSCPWDFSALLLVCTSANMEDGEIALKHTELHTHTILWEGTDWGQPVSQVEKELTRTIRAGFTEEVQASSRQASYRLNIAVAYCKAVAGRIAEAACCTRNDRPKHACNWSIFPGWVCFSSHDPTGLPKQVICISG